MHMSAHMSNRTYICNPDQAAASDDAIADRAHFCTHVYAHVNTCSHTCPYAGQAAAAADGAIADLVSDTHTDDGRHVCRHVHGLVYRHECSQVYTGMCIRMCADPCMGMCKNWCIYRCICMCHHVTSRCACSVHTRYSLTPSPNQLGTMTLVERFTRVYCCVAWRLDRDPTYLRGLPT